MMNAAMVVLATAIVSLNGNWNLKGWLTPERGSVQTLDAVPKAGISVRAWHRGKTR